MNAMFKLHHKYDVKMLSTHPIIVRLLYNFYVAFIININIWY